MVRTAKIDRRIFEIPSAKKYARLKQYSRSKIALMYFTWELAHRLAGGAGGVAGDSLSAALGGLGVAGVDNVVDDGLSAALGGLGIAGADVAGAGYVGGVCNVVSNAVYNAVVKNIAVCAVDPGVVNTGIITMHKWYDPLADIFARPFFKTPQTATNITMRAIADKRNNFLYKGKSQKRPLPPLNKEFSEWLWNETVYALFDN
jgi:hypothetical protein